MMDRRDFTKAALLGPAAATFFGGAAPSYAQAVDTLRIFVPAAPGGGWDQTARSLEMILKANNQIKAAQLTHVPGAGGAVGLPQFLNQWKGQNNSIMVAGMVMVGSLIANKTPVSLTEAVPIARLTGEFQVVVVPAASPHRNMGDLVKALKADPGKVSWAGGSAGGTDHILVGMIAQAAGVEPKSTSYVAFAGGGPAQAAILGNQVTAGVSGYGEFSEQIKAGKMRALGLSADRRLAGVDIPTLKEQGVDVELANWRGVFAPPGIGEAQRQSLVAMFEQLAKSAAWQDELKKRDWAGILISGDAYGQYIKAETTRIGAILKSLGLA
jgi:putative tricarboxylic transport membrane protein